MPCPGLLLHHFCGWTLFATQINWNETGEETYIWDKLKLRVFMNKANPLTLASLCGFVVSKAFSRHQLKNLEKCILNLEKCILDNNR